MLIEDFAKYMNHLTICRPIDKTWTQLVYHQSFAPSYGPVTIKNLDGLLNNQFIFSFNNPLVKKIRVNIKLEQTDLRLADGNVVPPITPNRIKLGLLIIEMSNSLDELFDFDPKMIVKTFKPLPQRDICTSFDAENKKYCIIPVTGSKEDACDYTLSIQFQSEQKYIEMGNGQKSKKLQAFGTTTHETSPEALKEFQSKNKIIQYIRTPNMMDQFINKRKDAPNKNKESIIENVRLVLKQETVFEDEAMGLSINFITPEEINALNEDQKNKMMLGVDIENDEEVEKQRKKEMS